MPITYDEVKSDARFKEKLDSFQAKRLKRLESEYQDLFLTGSREDGSKVFRTKNGTIISVDTDLGDSLSSLEVPEGCTIYGRWSAVTIGANDTAIVYRG